MLELNFYRFTEKITIKIFINPKDRIYDLYKDECEKTQMESSKTRKMEIYYEYLYRFFIKIYGRVKDVKGI